MSPILHYTLVGYAQEAGSGCLLGKSMSQMYAVLSEAGLVVLAAQILCQVKNQTRSDCELPQMSIENTVRQFRVWNACDIGTNQTQTWDVIGGRVRV